MKTKIEWTDYSWNPITGCSKISEGCQNCYAERMARRLAGRYGYPKDEPFQMIFHPDKLYDPLCWKKPKRIFVVSMGDLFHEDVPGYIIHQIFKVVKISRQHAFLFLTKRPERMRRIWMNIDGVRPDNAWLGVSIENQKRADERIPVLLQIPAKVRFVSIEPMLGPVDLASKGYLISADPFDVDSLSAPIYTKNIDWVIVGGETGPGARPMQLDWPRKVRDDCKEAGVPFFFKRWSTSHKQLGRLENLDDRQSWVMSGGRKLDGRIWEEWPE